MNKQARFWRLGIGLMVLPLGLMAVGCGASQGTVSGKVTYRGKAVPGGTVFIIPSTGGSMSGSIQTDGSYTIAKVPAGSAKVTVETESVKPASSAPPKARGAANYYAKAPKAPEGSPGAGKAVVPGSSGGDASRYVEIPKQYNDVDTSGLTLTVKGGNNPFDIDLK